MCFGQRNVAAGQVEFAWASQFIFKTNCFFHAATAAAWAPHGLSSDRDQIPHSEKFKELPKACKQMVGNRKTGKTHPCLRSHKSGQHSTS